MRGTVKTNRGLIWTEVLIIYVTDAGENRIIKKMVETKDEAGIKQAIENGRDEAESYNDTNRSRQQ